MQARTGRRLLVAVAILAAVAAAPASAPAAEEEPSVSEWNGYLFRDDDGRVRLGWPVVAMGVMAMPAYVVEGDLAARLAPLVSEVESDYVFWNYSLADAEEGELPPLPQALVRLRGKVEVEGDGGDLPFGDGVNRMTEGRLVSVEFVPRAWLRAWAPWFGSALFSLKGDPRTFRPTPEMERKFAPKALATLRAMRAAPGATEEERALARRIEPAAEVVESFRREKERVILRWLVAKNEELGLGMGDLTEEFGPLPPTAVEVQRWFMAAETREAFLAKVGAEWKGDFADLPLPYYEERGNRTSLRYATAAAVRDAWTDADYRGHRAVTKKTLDR